MDKVFDLSVLYGVWSRVASSCDVFVLLDQISGRLLDIANPGLRFLVEGWYAEKIETQTLLGTLEVLLAGNVDLGTNNKIVTCSNKSVSGHIRHSIDL